ncbi:MAG: class E sortase [Actinomycetota bacterium]
MLVRRGVALVALALIAGGIALLAYPGVTDRYQARQQTRLRREFAAASGATPTPAAAGEASPSPVPLREAMAVIRIPAIGLNAVVVQGTDAQALRTGPGHYLGTPGPCAGGNANTAIAGHRTTYGHPFNRMDDLVAGEDITLTTPAGSCTYEILPALEGRVTPSPGSASWIIAPNDWSVVSPLTLAGSYLTLTTCNPKGSASQRLAVRGRLIAATPA